MKFGLTENDLAYIISVISEFDEIEKAVIFGSRAKGNYKAASDVDIAVFGDDISFSIIAHLHSRLEEEGPLPYLFDVVDYTHSTHRELKEHIERIGKIIYLKSSGEYGNLFKNS